MYFEIVNMILEVLRYSPTTPEKKVKYGLEAITYRAPTTGQNCHLNGNCRFPLRIWKSKFKTCKIKTKKLNFQMWHMSLQIMQNFSTKSWIFQLRKMYLKYHVWLFFTNFPLKFGFLFSSLFLFLAVKFIYLAINH